MTYLVDLINNKQYYLREGKKYKFIYIHNDEGFAKI